jgi:hypothetical protein
MTKYLLILLLLNIFNLVDCKEKLKVIHYVEQDGDTLTLFGSVKSIELTNYKAVDSLGNITKGEYISSGFSPVHESLTFDNQGKILKISEIHSSGLILESIFKNEELIELRGYKNGNLVELTLFKRIKGVIAERKVYLDSVLITLEKSTVDKNNRVERIESFDKEGNVNWTQYCKYYYDNSFLEKEEWFNDKNDLVSQTKYDKYGNKINSIEVLTDIQRQKKDTTNNKFEYSNKKISKKLIFKSGTTEPTQTVKYVYNNLGKLIKSETFDKKYPSVQLHLA